MWSYTDGDEDGTEEAKGQGEGIDGEDDAEVSLAVGLNDEVRFRVRTIDYTQVRTWRITHGGGREYSYTHDLACRGHETINPVPLRGQHGVRRFRQTRLGIAKCRAP